VGRGEQLSVARPPGRVIGAPQAPLKTTGSSNTRLDLKKNTKGGIVCNFKNSPQKIGQTVGEILGR
jgi:hypothetical protein